VTNVMPDNDSSGFLSHDMKPIQQVFGLGIEIQLQLTHRIAAVRKKGYLLIHLHALGFEHLKHTPLRLGIVAMDKGKTLCGSLGRDTFARNHLKPAVFA
jgi:hypothetical protein